MYEETPWTFDANDVSDRPYTSERSGDAPSFESGAEVTVSNADEKSVVVSFPSAVSADETDNNDMISRYKVVLTDQETESSVTRYVFADYYKNPDRRRADWDVKITGLSEGTTYDVAVTAVTSFGQESEPITGEAQTTEDVYVTPTADVLDVDFERDNTGADANGRELDVYGAPQIKHDDEIDRDVMVFDGVDDGLRYTMSRDIYEKLTSDITVELYYKPIDTKNNDPLGSTQQAGFCFEQVSGTNNLQAWVHVGGSYKKPTATVEKDKWNHVMFTYDGENVKIYLNGEEKDSVSASGEMSIGPLYLFLGGDSTSNGSLEFEANCEIALAKVYTGAMNADDVKKTYDATVNGTSETPSPTATPTATETPSPVPTETPTATASPEPTETPDESAVSASVSGPEHAARNELVQYVFSLSGNTEKLETMHLNFTISGSEDGVFLGQTLEGLNSCSVYAQQKETSENGDITYDVVMGYIPGTEDEVLSEIGDILQLNVRMASDKTGSVSVKLNSILFNSEVTGGREEWVNHFSDVSESDWFYDAVRYANMNGLFGGVSETVFAPDMSITRGMMVTVLYRAEGGPEAGVCAFSDVPGDAYYADAVAWAEANGIVKGYSETEFGPDDNITREQIAAIMHRYAGFKGVDGDTAGDLGAFSDADKVSGWAEEDMRWAVGTGLINGRGESIDPLGLATRAETAAVLQRFIEGTE